MGKYDKIEIQHICLNICSGGTPKSTVTEYYGGNIPWLNTKEINFCRIYETERTITDEGLNNSSAKWFPANTVIVAMYGATAGKTAIAKIPLTTNQACCNLNIDSAIADYRFVYYALYNNYAYLASLANGGAQQNLNAQQIKEFEIPFPPLKEQKRIADILSSLDDKIELNRRINGNLEQQAQALFKAWFVDFEPFKDGKFVDSELGRIPEGWKVGRFNNIIESTLSGDWGKERQEGNYIKKVFCLRGADIPDVKIGNKGYMPIRFILEKNFATKALTAGNLVIEISGGSPTQSTGRICRISHELLTKYNNSIVCTNFCKAIRPMVGYSSFMYYMWEKLYNEGVMFSYENGTTGIKNLDINGLTQKEPIIIPPIEVALNFEKYVDIYYNKIQKNGIESEQLSHLRDTLLPRLMSSELNVNTITE